MALRVCIEPGCPALTDSTRCTEHTRQRDRARGSSTARGYGARHRRARAAEAPDVEAGRVTCWRCGKRIHPGQPWNQGHCDDDRSAYHGPEHEACNLGHTRGGCTHPSHF